MFTIITADKNRKNVVILRKCARVFRSGQKPAGSLATINNSLLSLFLSLSLSLPPRDFAAAAIDY
jgi:hypothetical protein